VIAGYAVEACWEPPTVMPVTNPFVDFPITANQPEAYYFRYVVNEGETITDCEAWLTMPTIDCTHTYIELAQWGGITSNHYMRLYFAGGGDGGGLDPCEPPVEGRFEGYHMGECQYGNGTFRGFCYIYRFELGYHYDFAYTVFDWTVDDPDQ
jgi:hypothetical protein